ncbi:Phosphoglucosamine mutase [hydrothermal vent metagenome]|uniref:Phosphoglucosamine mutase n=1 Tax=hydrothermal vent metagenome TaxID=652676 RepID=A0A3B0ZW34_9ZZZZ
MSRKYFGTDGIRGKVGKFPITPDFVLRLGYAVGKVLGEEGGSVVIGKDARISGYMFESVLEAGLTAAGVNVVLLGVMPTPGIAYLTRTLHANAGIVISASHNPYYDNGIKFFSADGTKLADEVELEIERMLDHPMDCNDSSHLGKAVRMDDADGRYIEFCKHTIPSGMNLAGLKVVVDCANGATYDVAPKIFTELRAEVIAIGNEPNGININADCGSTQPAQLQQAVKTHQADVGIALDGDGDRLIMVDRHGNLVDGDELLYAIAMAAKVNQTLNGGVVGTLMTNLGLEHAFERADIPFTRAKVGDRHVMEQLLANDWNLGGESSGHLICLDKNTTGDGCVAALQVLAAMISQGKQLHELVADMSKYPQIMINVRLEEKLDLCSCQPVQKAVQQAEKELADTGRVLLRASGTEPVIRVMVEGQDAGQVERLATTIAKEVEAQI